MRCASAPRCTARSGPTAWQPNPWRKEPSEAQREHTRTLAAKRRAEARKQPSGGRETAMSERAATSLPAAELSTGETANSGGVADWAAAGEEAVQ